MSKHCSDPKSVAINRSMTLVGGIYSEAIELTEMARACVLDHEAILCYEHNRDDVPFAREIARLTARLSQILVWFMTQRGVLQGRVSVAEALTEPYRVTNRPDLSEEIGEDDARIPQDFREILIASRFLYQRAMRLDSLFERNSGHLAVLQPKKGASSARPRKRIAGKLNREGRASKV